MIINIPKRAQKVNVTARVTLEVEQEVKRIAERHQAPLGTVLGCLLNTGLEAYRAEESRAEDHGGEPLILDQE